MKSVVTEKEMQRSVAFTGYRPSKLPYLNNPNCKEFKTLSYALSAEYDRLIKSGYKYFLTGGALGCDLLAAEIILKLKKEYSRKHIGHFLCLPCKNHDAKWEQRDKDRLQEIKKHSVVTYISDREYYDGCMQKRNKYMVDTSGVLIAVYDGISGGTKNTVEYAQSKGKQLIIIRPRDMIRMQFIETEEDIKKLITD